MKQRNNVHQKTFVARQFGAHGERIVTGIDTSVPDFPMLMTIDQAAVALATTRIGITNAIAAGELPVVKMRGRVKIVTGKMLERFHRFEAARLARVASARLGSALAYDAASNGESV